MTPEEAVEALDAIDPKGDPERAHDEADRILLHTVPQEVREAYQRVVSRSPWWATA